jgi:hypothetical protein
MTSDITLNKKWCKEHSDRLLNWEYFISCVTHSDSFLSYSDLCDRIGVNKQTEQMRCERIFKIIKNNYERSGDTWVDDLS